MKIYLSYPVDLAKPDVMRYVQHQLVDIEDWLRNEQPAGADPVVLFKPGDGFEVCQPHGNPLPLQHGDIQWIMSVNLQAMVQADCMLLFFHPDAATWGCPQELMLAEEHNVPVWVLRPADDNDWLPVYLAGRLPENERRVYSNVPDLLCAITARLVEPPF